MINMLSPTQLSIIQQIPVIEWQIILGIIVVIGVLISAIG